MVKRILKYLIMAVVTVAIYTIIKYWTGATIDIKDLVQYAFTLSVIYCVLALSAPHLRKLFGYKNTEE